MLFEFGLDDMRPFVVRRRPVAEESGFERVDFLKLVVEVSFFKLEIRVVSIPKRLLIDENSARLQKLNLLKIL